jgi:Bifunctional DNA primase/polymerase, N-terminal/Primase C terminal 2 (PriCT-2)/Family of unknown function (DUF5906)
MLSISPDSLFQAALKYAQQGWDVFPAPPGQKKSFKSAAHSGGRRWGKTRDLEEIKQDWLRWPEANIGLPTGIESGFWVLEADTPRGHSVDGIEALKELEARHGKLPPTLMAISPSGSTHYYWKWVDGIDIKNSAGRVAPGVDVRGEGGMVIAPPSARADGDYRWLNDLPIAEAPAWLVEAAKAAARRPAPESRPSTQVDLDKLKAALKVLPNDDLGWDDWNRVAMAIYRDTGGSQDGLELFHEWSKKWDRYSEADTNERWAKLHTSPPDQITGRTIYFMANEICPGWDRYTIDSFYAYLPMHTYIFLPTREHWPAVSVNSKLPKVELLDASGQPIVDGEGKPKKISPAAWLDQNRSVEQMTWAPGQPERIKDKVVKEGGWVDNPGTATFNLYQAPNIIRGDAVRAGPWLDHCDKLLGVAGRKHVVAWFAQRIQKPHEKINHAIVLGGAPGIGKDTLLEPVKRAVGSWNFAEASPSKMLGQFNAKYLQAVILRISEARDLGEVDRYDFYERMKTVTAAPPDVLTVNEKFIKEYTIFNCVGVVYTTNYKHGGIYLPGDDRRHYVVWSDSTPADFSADYWDEIWDWYEAGGDTYVAAYLANHDIRIFNPKAPPEKTDSFWEMVHANDAPEDMELADVIEHMGKPTALTIGEIKAQAGFGSEFDSWLTDRRTRRVIPHRLEKCGYVSVRNPDAESGMWKVKGNTTPIYARRELSPRDQIEAARACKTRVETASPSRPGA